MLPRISNRLGHRTPAGCAKKAEPKLERPSNSCVAPPDGTKNVEQALRASWRAVPGNCSRTASQSGPTPRSVARDRRELVDRHRNEVRVGGRGVGQPVGGGTVWVAELFAAASSRRARSTTSSHRVPGSPAPRPVSAEAGDLVISCGFANSVQVLDPATAAQSSESARGITDPKVRTLS